MLFVRNESDARIIGRVLAGRREEFSKLIRRHEPAVRSVALAHISASVDVQDVVQDTFIAGYTRLDTLRERKQFASWITSIARNTAVTYVRKELRIRALHERCPTVQEERNVDEGRGEMYGVLHAELEELDPGHREILLLYYFAHMRTRRVAETLGLTVEAVKKRLQRARAQLGERLIERLASETEDREVHDRRLAGLTRAVLAVPVAWQVPASLSLLALAKSAWEIPMIKFATTSAAIATVGLTSWFAVPTVLSRTTERASNTPKALYESADAANLAMPPSIRTNNELTELADSPKEPLVLTAATQSGAGYVSAGSDGVTAFDPGPAMIVGRVEYADGSPVTNAVIEATRRQWDAYKLPDKDRLTIRTFTDSDGRFQLRDLALDTFILRALTDSHEAIRTCALRDDLPKMDVTMTVEKTGSVAGKVVDEEGNPLAGAMVVPFYTERENRNWRLDIRTLHGTVTDSNGDFLLDHLWAEGQWSVMAQAPGYGSRVSELVAVDSNPLRVQLSPDGVWTGQVLLADTNEPVPGLELTVQSADPVREKYVVETDENGAFAVFGLREDEGYAIEDDLENGLLLTNPVSVRLQEPGGVIENTFFVEQGGRISGQVTLAGSGAPVPEAILRIDAVVDSEEGSAEEPARKTLARVEADEHGMYEIVGLREGDYSIHAEQSEYGGLGRGVIYTTGISINEPTRPLKHEGEPAMTMFALGRGEQRSGANFAVDPEYVARIAGVVVDPSGRPVALADVAVSPVGGGFVHRTHTDAVGEFVVQDPRLIGDVHIQAWTDDMATTLTGPFSLAAEDVEGIALSLEPACGYVEGRIVDELGNPVYAVGITPRLEAPSLRDITTEISNRIGRFEFRGLVPGTYTIDLGPARIVDGHHHPHQPNTATIEILDCEPVRGIELVLREDGESGEGVVDVTDF